MGAGAPQHQHGRVKGTHTGADVGQRPSSFLRAPTTLREKVPGHPAFLTPGSRKKPDLVYNDTRKVFNFRLQNCKHVASLHDQASSGINSKVGECGSGGGAAHRAHICRQKHVCFFAFWGEQEICKPPWGSVTAGFSQKGRQNHLFAGIDASPLVKRETQHETYAPHPSRKRERWRSIYGSASRRYVWRKA